MTTARLGEGAYTVAEVCRILRPTMTPRKVHYWLDTGLLSGPPVIRGRSGVPTLLSFRQLLEVRTVQRMRDDLRVALPRVREAFAWVLGTVFADTPTAVRFERGPGGTVIARNQAGETVEIPTGQGVLDLDVSGLNAVVTGSLLAWERKVYAIPDLPHVVANARVLAGAPTVSGTRVETAVIAAFAVDGRYDAGVLAAIRRAYPHLSAAAVRDALEFEGVHPAAA